MKKQIPLGASAVAALMALAFPPSRTVAGTSLVQLTIAANQSANGFSIVNHFRATDALSGVASLTPASTIISAEGAGLTVAATATDNACNSNS